MPRPPLAYRFYKTNNNVCATIIKDCAKFGLPNAKEEELAQILCHVTIIFFLMKKKKQLWNFLRILLHIMFNPKTLAPQNYSL